MSKVTKKIANLLLHTLSGVVLVAILLILTIAMALSLPRVQSFAASELTQWLSRKCDVSISVGALSIENISHISAEEIYVEDLAGDTLLWVGKLTGRIDRKALLDEGRLVPYDAKVRDAKLYLVETPNGKTNIDDLIAHIAGHFPADSTTNGGDFAIRKVSAEQFRFKLYNERLAGRTPESAIDYSDMDIMVENADFEEIAIKGKDLIITGISNLNATDISGAELHGSSLGALTVGEGLLDFRGVDFHTGGSRLRLPYLIISAPTWEDYIDFCDKTTLNLQLQNTIIEPLSAGKWVAELGEFGLRGENVNGIFEGTVNDFAADIVAQLYDSEVTLIGEVQGITAPATMHADLNLNLATTPEKVGNIYRSVLHEEVPQEVAVWLERTDSLVLATRTEVAPERVTTDSRLGTNIGEVTINGTLNYGSEGTRFDGKVSTDRFDLGRLLNIAELGKVDMSADGKVSLDKSDSIEGEARVAIRSAAWGEYDFRDVALQATKSGNFLTARLTSNDPNARLYAEGDGKLDGKESEYNLILNLENIDFGAIGIAPKDKTSWLAGNMEASLRGGGLDDMVGRAMINNLVYASSADTLSTELVNISLSGGERDKSFSLYSPILDVEYRSTAPYKEVLDYLTQTLPAQLPLAKSPLKAEEGATEKYGSRLYAADDYTAATINIKEGEHLAAVLIEGANLAPDSSVSVEFSPSSREFSLLVESDYAAAEDVVISALRIEAEGADYALGFNAECEELLIGEVSIPEISVQANTAEEGKVGATLYFSNSDAALSGRLAVDGRLWRDEMGKALASGSIADSYIISPENRWDIVAKGIDYTSEAVTIEGFAAECGAGGIYLDGAVSKATTTPLTLALKDVALGEWLGLLTDTKNVYGTANGNIELHSALGNPYGEGMLSLSGLSAGGVGIDPLGLSVEIPTKSTMAHFALTNTLAAKRLVEGEYDYKKGTYRANLMVGEMDLSLLNPLLEGIANDIKGNGSIDLQLSGKKNTLDIDGNVRVADLGAKLGFTGAAYNSELLEVTFENNRGVITPARIGDQEGGWAEAEGFIDLGNLSNVGFGISLVPHNLTVIDLPAGEQHPFYGKVYASGGIKLLSKGGTTEVSGAVSTGAGSVFSLPLTGNNDFAGADFVTFVSHSQEDEVRPADILVRTKKSERAALRKSTSQGGLNLDVMLGVGTNTLLRLIIDPATDNVIEARGVADLGITFDERKDEFAIRGDYEISEGVYNFNFQNLITKQFDINPDSYIRWNGSPLDANIDVGATYKLKTSLAPLLGAESTASRASTPVECIVNLTGSLSKVDVSFDINVPNANTEYRNILSSYFSSQEMMATQFVYLLALGNFYSDTAPEQTNTPGAAGTAIGIDFLANQVSRLVSNDAYKFNLKYKAIDDTSSSYSIDFETEIIDDRLLLELEANVDTGDYYNFGDNNGNQLSGGGAITLLLDDNGDFYLKGFSRTIDRFDENQGLQENGVGLYYKRSFNRLSDLWRKKKDKERKE